MLIRHGNASSVRLSKLAIKVCNISSLSSPYIISYRTLQNAVITVREKNLKISKITNVHETVCQGFKKILDIILRGGLFLIIIRLHTVEIRF